MTKYSEIEVQTANNLLKEGYKWIVRGYYGVLFAYESKPIEDYEPKTVCNYYVPIFESIKRNDKEPVSLKSIVHPQILDDVEKRYLSAVIRPFRNDVQYIVKFAGKFSSRAYEEISIRYKDKMCEDKHSFSLPRFDKGTMYKGMEVNRHYTLRELEL